MILKEDLLEYMHAPSLYLYKNVKEKFNYDHDEELIRILTSGNSVQGYHGTTGDGS